MLNRENQHGLNYKTQGHQRLLQCYRCQGYDHRQSESLIKVSTGKDQESSTPVDQSNQKKTRAMVAKSYEDGEESFMCVNMERPRSSGNSKKSSLNNQRAMIRQYTVLLTMSKAMMVRSTLE